MIELCIEVDKNNRSIGLRPITDFKTGKFIHRSVHLLLFNSKGEILIQKRSANKIWYPNLYTYSVSGVVENENYKNCIKREMKEEIGINTPVNLLFIYPYFDKLDKSFHALFKGKTNKKIIPDKNEMSLIKWMTLGELKRDISKKPDNYVPHVVFGLKKYFSEIQKSK